MARNPGQRENEAGAKWLSWQGPLFQVPDFSVVAEPQEPVSDAHPANDVEIKHLIDKKLIISSSSLQI